MIGELVRARRIRGRCCGLAVVGGLLCWAWFGAGVAGATTTATTTFNSAGSYTFTVPRG